jgi:predicted O-methyltransferase YrrM
MRFVTSFGPEGYTLYGERFIKSFLENGPEEAELYVYYEDEKPPIEDPRITYKDLYHIEGAVDYLSAVGMLPIFRGIIGGRRYYQYDIFTFARKFFAQMDAAVDYGGLLFWMDADVFIQRPFPTKMLEQALDGEDYMCYLGRPGWHSCASLVGWDCSHPVNAHFWETLHGVYISGQVLLMKEWHDSFVLDQVREQMGLPAVDLAKDIKMPDGPVNVFDLVFGKWMTHRKGNLKHVMSRYGQLIDLVREMQPSRIMEIGTWKGERAVEMHAAAPDAQYIGFDLFEYATEEDNETEKNGKGNSNLNEVVKLLADYGVNSDLFPGYTRDSLPAYLEKYGEHSADLIFIDGGHSVETIQSDWEFARRAIRPGGVVVFDDYYEDMPEEDLEVWGANKTLKDVEHVLLPLKDKVKGGGFTRLAMVRC